MNSSKLFFYLLVMHTSCSVYSMDLDSLFAKHPTHVETLKGMTAHAIVSLACTYGALLGGQKLDDSIKAALGISFLSCMAAAAIGVHLDYKGNALLSPNLNIMAKKERFRMRQILVGAGVGLFTPFVADSYCRPDRSLEVSDMCLPVAGLALIGAGVISDYIFNKTGKDN